MIDDLPWNVWRKAAASPTVDRALRDLHARLDAAVAARGPTCWKSGNCCHFDDFGHLLYVTGLEIAWFLGHTQSPRLNPQTLGAGEPKEKQEPQPGNRQAALSLPLHPTSSSSPPSPRTPPASDFPTPALPADLPPTCPYQVNGLCTTHTIRPLGCRIFFCQHGTEQWQHELYEQFLRELQQMHHHFHLPYRYLEWRAGLAAAPTASTHTAPR